MSAQRTADEHTVRFVLCDEDQMLRSMVESIVTRQGHEVVGVADTTAAGTSLVENAHPDAVIVDASLGCNTDFDVLEAAVGVGAQAIVFSFTTDSDRLDRYATRPIVVHKPDLTELEHAVERLGIVGFASAAMTDRRRRPQRAASGPAPSGLGDAQAFYESINNAVEGDTIVFVDLGDDAPPGMSGEVIAASVARTIRDTDRLLACSSSVKVFLSAGGEEGTASLMRRLERDVQLPPGARVRSVVVGSAESPMDAFDRLKRMDGSC
jgi:DNA-binding NarL/FixJ family response regulator